MAKMNFKDALNRSLRATKKYIDDAINTNSIVKPYEVFRVEETIFGKTGYIDVETMEPSVKYGLTEEYLDCNSFAFIVPTATTPYAIVCIASSFQVSDLMVTEKWEGDPSKGEEGLYIIVQGLNVDYKINIRHKESKAGVTIETIRNTRYLGISNTKEFIPTGDYNPATKKYADEAAENIIIENINKPYGDFVEYISADFEIDANKNIVNSSAFESTAKTDSGSNHNIIARFNIIKPDYFDLFSNTSYKYRAKIYLDGVLLDEVAGVKTGNMSSGSTTAVTFTDPASYPRLQFRWYRDNNYVNGDGTRVNSQGDLAIQLNYVYTDTVATVWHPAKITVKLEIQAANDLNITSFVTLKEGKNGRTICRSDVDEDIISIGPGSLGLTSTATDPVPPNSIIIGSNNTYIANDPTSTGSCSYLNVLGYNNVMDMLTYAQVIGYGNTIDSYYSGAGMKGVSVIGVNNKFVEPSGDRDSYLTMHGENLNANNCGAFFGVNGTIPHSEIFAVCNGETTEDAPIFSINRNTGAVTSVGEPTADNHLVTKKYVDDTVTSATPAIITEEDINAIIADIDN